MLYQGISQPIRAFSRAMSACGRARDVCERGVSGVQVGQMGDLIGAHGAAAAGMLGPAEHPGFDKVEAQLAGIRRLPELVRSFFNEPSVAYIAD